MSARRRRGGRRPRRRSPTASGCRCTGDGHEDFSLFLAEPKLRELLDGLYEEPELTVIVSEVLQAITSHRDDGKPLTLEAGIVRVADALDMAQGPLADPVRARPRLDPLAVGGRDRGRRDQGRRGAARS